jgi:thiol-disulfide isomerase/thioredoxin
MNAHLATIAALLGVIALATASVRGDAASAAGKSKLETLPASRGGQEVVGTKLPALSFDRWIPDAPPHVEGDRPLVTLYRWWTTGCPFCEKTLPAVEQLRQRYEKQGLQVVAVFHPKPIGHVDDSRIAQAAKRIGYAGRIAVDEDWSELKRAYLDRSDTARATSVTLLIDHAGLVRFVHPGTQYFPSKDPNAAQENADYQLIEQAIEALLAEDK